MHSNSNPCCRNEAGPSGRGDEPDGSAGASVVSASKSRATPTAAAAGSRGPDTHSDPGTLAGPRKERSPDALRPMIVPLAEGVRRRQTPPASVQPLAPAPWVKPRTQEKKRGRTAPPQHPLWMTFRDSLLEQRFRLWQAGQQTRVCFHTLFFWLSTKETCLLVVSIKELVINKLLSSQGPNQKSHIMISQLSN